MGLEKLAEAMIENEGEIKALGKNAQSITVRRAFMFGKKPRISMKNEDVNIEAEETAKKTNPFYNRLQVCIGYQIKNDGTETIKDIIIPEYKQGDDGWYYGVEKKVNLETGKTLDMPTKYLSFLLMRPEFNLKCKNGYMKKQINKTALIKKDVDAILQGFQFISAPEYKKVCEADGFYYMIGQAVYDEEHTSQPKCWEVVDKYCKTFGNYNNPQAEAKGRPTEVKIDITDESALLLASILNLADRT